MREAFFSVQRRTKLCIRKMKNAIVVRKQKIQLTISLCANIVADKETPLVIWKLLNPRCFNRVKAKTLPVKYHTIKKAWIASGIFETWLKKFDKFIDHKGRNVLLFLDNAISYSNIWLCNVKLKFFPASTTSILESIDLAIIQAMKGKYHQTQFRYMITQMERRKEKDYSQLLKEINVVKAIYWIKLVWNDTIANWFQKFWFCCKHCRQRDRRTVWPYYIWVTWNLWE